MFIKETSIKALLKYILYNYEILLKEGKGLLFSFIYNILIKDLKTFKRYINENLKKGFIWLLILLIISKVLLILKKDKIKKIYIDYQKLNIIIIKD